MIIEYFRNYDSSQFDYPYQSRTTKIASYVFDFEDEADGYYSFDRDTI